MTTTQAMLAHLAAQGCDVPEIAILQPADAFLETAGEDLRRRIFITQDQSGETLCLRPEFTIPVCLHHLASHAETPKRYAYGGTVFRQHRLGSEEFQQAGLEDFGRADRVGADVDCIGQMMAALVEAKVDQPVLVLGDRALFGAVVNALGLPKGWQDRLLRCFGDAELLAAAITQLGADNSQADDSSEPADFAATVALVADKLDAAGLSHSAGRTAEEIARRMIEKAALARFRLSAADTAILKRFLEMDLPLVDAPAALDRFESETGLSIGEAKQDFSERVARMQSADVDFSRSTFRASFGRNLDYYTGAFFEARDASNIVLAGGGRYDHLLTLLGAKVAIPAVGFSIWLDRIVEGDSA